MEINYTVVYHEKVVSDDLPHIDARFKQRIREAVEQKLTSRPEIFGKPLRQSLKGYRKLRVGDYRIVFRIAGGKVFVLTIQHRSVVYQTLAKRVPGA